MDRIDPYLAGWFNSRNLKPKSHFDTSDQARDVWLALPKDQDLPIIYRDTIFDKIVETLNEHQDIEGLLGFSQGGFMVSVFFQYLEKGLFKEILKVKNIPHFAIMVCGWSGIGSTIIKAKSLHLIGTLDEVYNMSELALIRFRKPKVFFFQEGHKFPILNKKLKQTISEFVKKSNEGVYRELIGYDFNKEKL